MTTGKNTLAFRGIKLALILIVAVVFLNLFYSSAQIIRQPFYEAKSETPLVPTTLSDGVIAIICYITNGSPDSFSLILFRSARSNRYQRIRSGIFI